MVKACHISEPVFPTKKIYKLQVFRPTLCKIELCIRGGWFYALVFV